MSDLILPRSSASREMGGWQEPVQEILFQDGTTVFDHRQGDIQHVHVISNPDGTPEHPSTNEQPLVRGLMSHLYKTAIRGLLSGNGIPAVLMRDREPTDYGFADDVTEVADFSIIDKDGDYYYDYANTTGLLELSGLVAEGRLDGSAYERIELES